MFHEKATEVVAFAMKGPLLQPRSSQPPEGRFGLCTANLDEAFRLYGLPVRKPTEAQGMGLLYLPDAVANEQGKLTEYGTPHSNYSTAALVMKERIRIAISFRIGKSNPDLDNEVDGALCAILEGRLARGDTIRLLEDMFYAYQCGYWPFAIRQMGKKRLLAVYVGGVVLDNATLDLPH
jgi:hypothetical protein